MNTYVDTVSSMSDGDLVMEFKKVLIDFALVDFGTLEENALENKIFVCETEILRRLEGQK